MTVAIAFKILVQEKGQRIGEEDGDLQFLLGIVDVACHDLSSGSPTEKGYRAELTIGQEREVEVKPSFEKSYEYGTAKAKACCKR